MDFRKICLAILIGTVFVSSSDLDLSDTYCDGTGWVAYKDEKCFKLIQKWSTRDEAKDICEQELLKTDSTTPQLVSIKSADEQDYLTEFVFDTSAVEVNIWIGAKRLPESPNKFVWDDGSELEFENWLEDSPTEDVNVGCAVMQSKYMRMLPNATKRRINGKWRDVTCRSGNYVVCEKLPRWSFGKLQQTILKQRNELTETRNQLINTQNKLKEVENKQTNTQNALSDTKIKLEQTENRLNVTENNFEVSRKNPIPIGFIYVQLPNQPEPKTLWPTVQWKDVTSEYAGMFFRAEGGGAAEFGTEQKENAPRVTKVVMENHANPNDGSWDNTTLTVGGPSSGIGIYSGSYVQPYHWTHRFYQSGGEVRPKNMAMRVWKRVA